MWGYIDTRQAGFKRERYKNGLLERAPKRNGGPLYRQFKLPQSIEAGHGGAWSGHLHARIFAERWVGWGHCGAPCGNEIRLCGQVPVSTTLGTLPISFIRARLGLVYNRTPRPRHQEHTQRA